MCPRRGMCGRRAASSAARRRRSCGRRVASSASVDSSNGTRPSARPALLKRMSTPPSAATAASTNALAARASSVTSSGSATSASIALARARGAAPATRTPRLAQLRARVAAPMPDEAPDDDRRSCRVRSDAPPDASTRSRRAATGATVRGSPGHRPSHDPADGCSRPPTSEISTRSIVTGVVRLVAAVAIDVRDPVDDVHARS